MSKIKSKNNKSTELKLIEYFKELGIKGWRRNYKLFGKPDFAFPKEKIVVFVDGYFGTGTIAEILIRNRIKNIGKTK